MLVTLGLGFLTWKKILLFLPVVSFLLLIPFWRFAVEPKQERREKGRGFAELLRRRPVRIISLLWILPAAANLGVYTILPLFLIKERGMDFQFANSLLGISRIGGIVAPLSVGFLVDRYGYQKMLKWSLLSTGLSTVGLSLASGLPEIVAALVLQATLSLSFFPWVWLRSPGSPIFPTLHGHRNRHRRRGLLWNGCISIYPRGDCRPFEFPCGVLGLGVLTAFSSLGIKFLKES